MGNCVRTYSIKTISRKGSIAFDSSAIEFGELKLLFEVNNKDFESKQNIDRIISILRKMGFEVKESIFIFENDVFDVNISAYFDARHINCTGLLGKMS